MEKNMGRVLHLGMLGEPTRARGVLDFLKEFEA